MAGLVVGDKAERVRTFQEKTVHVALEITGALGYESADRISGKDVLRRMKSHGLSTFDEIYPWIATRPGALLDGSAPPALQAIWDGRVDPKHTLATHTMA